MKQSKRLTVYTRGYRVELDLTHEQLTACRKHAGAARWTYNYGVRRLQEAYQAGLPSPSRNDLLQELKLLKKQQPWMREMNPDVFQESLQDLDVAFKRFLHAYQLKQAGKWKGSCGFPRFKSKKKAIARVRFHSKLQVTADAIHLPVLGRLRLKEHNYIPAGAKISNATIREKAGHWYVSLVIAEKRPLPPAATGDVLGVALGMNRLATFSSGGSVGVPEALSKQVRALKRATRRTHRAVKGSANSEKARHQLARKRARLSHICTNALHQLTAHLVAKTKHPSERPRIIVIEEMSSFDRHKHRRWAPHILEVGFGRFKRQLTYKAAQAGVEVLLRAPQEAVSASCSFCGVLNEQLSPSSRLFECVACGMLLDRDENHARNLKAVDKQTMIP